MNETSDDIFNEKNEVKVEYNNIKFGKIGDWFKGTLTDNTRQMVNNLSPKKEMQTIFEFKAHGGSLHLLTDKKVNEEATEIKKDEFWSLISSKPAILNQLKKAQLGQVIGLRFTDELAPKQKGFDKTKVIKVYIGAMDPDYQGETQHD